MHPSTGPYTATLFFDNFQVRVLSISRRARPAAIAADRGRYEPPSRDAGAGASGAGGGSSTTGSWRGRLSPSRSSPRGPKKRPMTGKLPERLRPRDRDRRRQQVLGRVVARVARVPLGLELLVERPQRLDLHRVAHALEEPLLDPVHEPVAGLAREHRAERREVEREADVALAPEVLDRLDDDELGEAVRLIAALASGA